MSGSTSGQRLQVGMYVDAESYRRLRVDAVTWGTTATAVLDALLAEYAARSAHERQAYCSDAELRRRGAA